MRHYYESWDTVYKINFDCILTIFESSLLISVVDFCTVHIYHLARAYLPLHITWTSDSAENTYMKYSIQIQDGCRWKVVSKFSFKE
jgi:hypothetical protein